ncbi:MAG: tryptophan--tRNA ligase, partial [Thermoplasmatales archaeon]
DVPGNNFNITPWDVTGKIDYDKLIDQFGTQRISEEILQEINRISGNRLHVMLRRRIFFSHRDLDLILKDYREGRGFYLYTGRAPSLGMHIGHLIPFLFTKWLQDVFDVNVYIEITDDEKFLRNQEYSLNQTATWADDNILDIIAVGFNEDKTFIFKDTEYIRNMYPLTIEIAKKLNFSEVKATFGFDNSSNIGILFYPAIQIAPTMFERKRCLIPAAIDQDPYWRLQRDIAESLGYYKAAEIHSKFLPPLTSFEGKMSSSIPESAVYLSDDPKSIERKIMKYAYSGGQATAELQRKLGADLNVDVPYQWLFYLFEDNDEEIKRIAEEYSTGRMLTGEVKKILASKVSSFLEEHRKKKESARDRYSKYLYDGKLAQEMWEKIHI